RYRSLEMLRISQTGAVANAGGARRDLLQAGALSLISGSITLVPLAAAGAAATGKDVGKPAKAELKADGTFELSTYGQFDGAVPGRHKVIYEGPEGEEAGEEEEAAEGETETADPNARKARKTAKPKTALQVKEGTEVEVKSGSENRFVIELVEGPAMEEEPVE
ncbi:hypothetical protein E3A20_23080, partial [Planctomyces bekefii]